MRKLSFSEEFHEYRLTDTETGVFEIPVPVTEIVGKVTGKDYGKAKAEDLIAAQERGRLIHEDVEHETFETPEGQWIKGQLAFEDAFTFEDYLHEVIGWAEIDGVLFAGKADLILGANLMGAHEIGDIKSQSDEDPLGWTIQLNLYHQIFTAPESGSLHVLHVPKSGNYRKVPIAALPEEKMREIFSAYKEGRVLDKSFLSQVCIEPQTMELEIYHQSLGELTTNAKNILAMVKKQCSLYVPENYGPENVADAKRDKADLNALAEKLNKKRLELEREFMKPFGDFKDTINETVSVIKESSGKIDQVVKAVELREREERRKLLEDFFTGLKTELVSFEQVFEPAMLNKTAKVKDSQAAILAKIEKVKADLAVLDRINEPEAKALYLSSLNLDSALNKADEIKQNRERLQRSEAAKAEQQRANATALPQPLKPGEAPVRFNFNTPAPTPATEELMERTFFVRCPREKLIALGDWMNEQGIYFEKVMRAGAA
jgi:hypothetical protein